MPRDVRAIQRVLWTTLFLNLGVATAKLGYGLWSGLLAMAADGVHSYLDGGGNVIGLVAVAAARKPPDTDHPYGHRKFETFAALSIGGMLLLACYEILKATWHRLVEGGAPVVGPGGYAIMATAMLVSLGVSLYERREGRRLSSEVLLADSAHTASDVVTSLSVIAAMVAVQLGWAGVDVVVTLLIVVFIAGLAWRVMRPAVSTLADEVRLESGRLDEVVMTVDGVRDVHRIRTRGTHDAVFVDLHVQVDPKLTVEAAHDIAHRVEALIQARYPEVVDVITHLEPHGDPVEGLDGSIVGPPR